MAAEAREETGKNINAKTVRRTGSRFKNSVKKPIVNKTNKKRR